MEKNEETQTQDIGTLSFEKALEELEVIVNKMENERLPMETLIHAFERGSSLAAHCRKKLDELEKRVEVLNRQADGGEEWNEFQA